MRLPITRPRSSRELSVPDLFGGLNFRDSLSMVNDNQLTDSVNMWKQDGFLKTRPGMRTANVFEMSDATTDSSAKSYYGKDVKKHKIFENGPEGKMQLCSAPVYYSNNTEQYGKIFFFWVGDPTKGIIGVYNHKILHELTLDEPIDSYFVVEKEGVLYCFTSSMKIYTYKKPDEYADYEWMLIPEEDYHTPLVLTNCKPVSSTKKETVMASGVMVEGFNALGSYYKMIYTSVNRDWISTASATHGMIYSLLENVNQSKYVGMKVTAKLTNAKGVTRTHTITLTLSGVENEKDFDEVDNLRMCICEQELMFYKRDSQGGVNLAYVGLDEYVENNLEIIAPYIATEEGKKKIFRMTETEWFGGNATGLAGGTRLFLCGNTEEKEKGLVVWSALNNPTYFPENSYFYVGNKKETVTGFGKQQDMLVIFKNNETWYTKYNQNTNITAEDLINQSVVDLASSSVYFTLTMINPNIGCPYPDSIQLCRNRLVWLGYDGNVYTLVSDNQYNERNIYIVSEMVKKKLKKENVKKVSSADWNGHYCLSFGSSLYLMDYNCYGYNYISSYSKEEDANILIPWYYWEMPTDFDCDGKIAAITVDNALGWVGYSENGKLFYYDNVKTCFLNLNLKNDVLKLDTSFTEINCYFKTKLFDFRSPHIRKNIEKINLQLGNNGGLPISIELITESGTEEEEIILIGDETENYEAGAIDSYAVFPCIRNVLRFGVKLSCKGQMAVDGMIIKYRLTGGAR